MWKREREREEEKREGEENSGDRGGWGGEVAVD